MSDKILAWQVSHDFEDCSCIIFSKHGIAARRLGANELDVEFEYAKCRRAPDFDQYSDIGSVPSSVLIDAGWWFECFHCSHKMHLEDDEKDPSEYFYGKDGEYCSVDCKADKDFKIKSHNENFKLLSRHVKSIRPDLEFTKFEGEFPGCGFSASFKIDGCKFTGVARGSSVDNIEWSVPKVSLQKWLDYEKNRKEQVIA